MSTPADNQTLQSDDPSTPKRRLGPSYFKLFSASTISNLGDGVGVIAYPWLATAVTRNPILIALVAVAQRLPWLVFTLPAGVITDRHDRRTLMIWSNVARTILTAAVAFAVLNRQGTLPGPDVVADETIAIPTNMILYGVIILATLLMGIAEVLYDNSAQTFMPSIVHTDQLEKANGRMWSTEMIANTFVGPPLGALLIAVSFSLPFFADATSFAVSAALIALIPRTRPAPHDDAPDRKPWRAELAEGFRWLWHHELLRPMAIILGCLNALGMVTGSILILFGQEVLHTGPTAFAVLTTGGAVGGVIGGWTAGSVSRRLGAGPSLWLTLITSGVTTLLIGLMSWWPAVWFLFAVEIGVGVLWNVITVSLRQSIIPDHLLGRVNSVYRFFAWGMMPIGSLIGGLIVVVTDAFGSRELALRMPWLIAGAAYFVLFVFAAPKLTTAKIEAARANAIERTIV